MSDQEDPSRRQADAAPAAYAGRRLPDKITVAFHQACDIGDYEVAGHLLRILELMLSRKPGPAQAGRRRNMENLIAAHERLWHLRNPEA